MGRTTRQRRRKKLVPSLDHDRNSINLKQFMTRNGFITTNKLQLRNYLDTGRGVAILTTLTANNPIIRVPYTLMITLTACQSLDMFIKGAKLTIQDLLTCFLIMERHKKDSFWSSYINSLPACCPWLPALLSGHHIESLPVDLRLAVKKSRKVLEESWSRLKRSIQGEWKCKCCDMGLDCVLDFNSFVWSYVLVNTRAVYVDPDVIYSKSQKSVLYSLLGEPNMALCPYLDMFNHSCSARTKAGFTHQNGELVYELITLTPITRNAQVFIQYGAHDNVKLLTEYGFFIPDNPYDSVSFSNQEILQVLNISLNKQQQNFLVSHNLYENDFFISESGPSFKLKALLFVATQINKDDKKLSTIIYNDCYPENFLKNNLQMCCQKLLNYYLDTINRALINLNEVMDSNNVLLDFLQYRQNFLVNIVKLIHNV